MMDLYYLVRMAFDTLQKHLQKNLIYQESQILNKLGPAPPWRCVALPRAVPVPPFPSLPFRRALFPFARRARLRGVTASGNDCRSSRACFLLLVAALANVLWSKRRTEGCHGQRAWRHHVLRPQVHMGLGIGLGGAESFPDKSYARPLGRSDR